MKISNSRLAARALSDAELASIGAISAVRAKVPDDSYRTAANAVSQERISRGVDLRMRGVRRTVRLNIDFETEIAAALEVQAKAMFVSRRRLVASVMKIIVTTPGLLDNVLDGDRP